MTATSTYFSTSFFNASWVLGILHYIAYALHTADNDEQRESGLKICLVGARGGNYITRAGPGREVVVVVGSRE